MDAELRQAERDGDYQRQYALLNRAGRHEEANKLFLDHPIQVECSVQYSYTLIYTDSDHGIGSVSDFKLSTLIEKFVLLNISISYINSISRNPMAQIFGSFIRIDNFHFGEFAFPKLSQMILNPADLLEIKLKIRAHPYYMKSASVEQLEAATRAEEEETRTTLARLDVDRRLLEEEQEQAAYFQRFEADSEALKVETWNLWTQHKDLPRREFATTINQFSLQSILFHLKDVYTRDGNVTEDYFSANWAKVEEKRFRIWEEQPVEAAS